MSPGPRPARCPPAPAAAAFHRGCDPWTGRGSGWARWADRANRQEFGGGLAARGRAAATTAVRPRPAAETAILPEGRPAGPAAPAAPAARQPLPARTRPRRGRGRSARPTRRRGRPGHRRPGSGRHSSVDVAAEGMEPSARCAGRAKRSASAPGATLPRRGRAPARPPRWRATEAGRRRPARLPSAPPCTLRPSSPASTASCRRRRRWRGPRAPAATLGAPLRRKCPLPRKVFDVGQCAIAAPASCRSGKASSARWMPWPKIVRRPARPNRA